MEEAENLIRRVLKELSDPAIGGTTCTPSVLLERTKLCLDVIDNATANFSLYSNDSSGGFYCITYTSYISDYRKYYDSRYSVSHRYGVC